MRCLLSLPSLILMLLLAPAADSQTRTLKPTNLNKLNTKADEIDPCPTPDGQGLLYASNATGTFNLLWCRRVGAAPFGAGKPLAEVNSKAGDQRSPFLTRDNRLYFTTNKVPDEKFKDLKNFDIWVKPGLGAAVPLLLANTAEDELHPCVALQGKEFYFSRKTKDGWRVCFSVGPAVAVIGKGEEIPELPAGFHHATLSPTGLTMYLQGPKGDKSALFRSTRPRVGGKWSPPEEVEGLFDPESAKGDLAPALSATGSLLYFVSDRPGGQGGLDIWWISVSSLTKKK